MKNKVKISIPLTIKINGGEFRLNPIPPTGNFAGFEVSFKFEEHIYFTKEIILAIDDLESFMRNECLLKLLKLQKLNGG